MEKMKRMKKMKMSSDKSYLVIKFTSSDNSYLVIKVREVKIVKEIKKE